MLDLTYDYNFKICITAMNIIYTLIANYTQECAPKAKKIEDIMIEKICDLSLTRAILIFVSRNLPKFCYLALYHLKVEIGMDWRNYSALEVDLARVYAGKFGQILLKRVDS